MSYEQNDILYPPEGCSFLSPIVPYFGKIGTMHIPMFLSRLVTNIIKLNKYGKLSQLRTF